MCFVCPICSVCPSVILCALYALCALSAQALIYVICLPYVLCLPKRYPMCSTSTNSLGPVFNSCAALIVCVRPSVRVCVCVCPSDIWVRVKN